MKIAEKKNCLKHNFLYTKCFPLLRSHAMMPNILTIFHHTHIIIHKKKRNHPSPTLLSFRTPFPTRARPPSKEKKSIHLLWRIMYTQSSVFFLLNKKKRKKKFSQENGKVSTLFFSFIFIFFLDFDVVLVLVMYFYICREERKINCVLFLMVTF